jgi:hypothetical protein
VYRQRRTKDFLSGLSAVFNLGVVVMALSMTTILSAFAAGMLVLALSKDQAYRIPKMAGIVGVAVVGGIFNKLKYGVSYSDYLLAFNYHLEFMPKLNMYKKVIEEIAPDHPWTILVGHGVGTFMNRFAILFNFKNYAFYPFKGELMDFFNNENTIDKVIQAYHLEAGVVGNSILSVPWSSAMSLYLETGLLGIFILVLFLRNFGRDILKVRGGMIGTGLFFLAFVSFNSLFDVYMDYPETACSFLLIGLLLGAMGRVESAGTLRETPPALASAR